LPQGDRIPKISLFRTAAEGHTANTNKKPSLILRKRAAGRSGHSLRLISSFTGAHDTAKSHEPCQIPRHPLWQPLTGSSRVLMGMDNDLDRLPPVRHQLKPPGDIVERKMVRDQIVHDNRP